MWVLWPNVTVFVCGAIIIATLGFVIYGAIKGYENTFPND
jgi:hypothetical protein